MNKKRPILIVLMSISLLALGFAGGTYFGWTKLGKSSRSMERLFGTAGYAQYVAMEYQYANYRDAKKALLDYITMLDEGEKIKGIDDLNYRMYQVDIMISYVRLAILEDRNGNPKESEKYMREATKRCQDVKWKDCSPEKIRQLVEQLDRKLPNNN